MCLAHPDTPHGMGESTSSSEQRRIRTRRSSSSCLTSKEIGDEWHHLGDRDRPPIPATENPLLLVTWSEWSTVVSVLIRAVTATSVGEAPSALLDDIRELKAMSKLNQDMWATALSIPNRTSSARGPEALKIAAGSKHRHRRGYSKSRRSNSSEPTGDDSGRVTQRKSRAHRQRSIHHQSLRSSTGHVQKQPVRFAKSLPPGKGKKGEAAKKKG